MHRRLLASLSLLSLLLVVPAARALDSRGPGRSLTADQLRALRSLDPSVEVRFEDSSVPSALNGKLALRRVPDPGAAAAAALDELGPVFRRGPADGFRYRSRIDDSTGTHVRMVQTYKGLEVVGGELIVHLSESDVTGVNGRFVPDLDMPSRPSVSAAQAASIARDATIAMGGTDVEIVEVATPVVYALHVAEPAVSVPVRVRYLLEGESRLEDVYLEAGRGYVMARLSLVQTGKFRQIYKGRTTSNSEFPLCSLPGNLATSEGGTSSDTEVMNAYNNSGTTYDYYRSVFGRDSYDARGSALVSTVKYQLNCGFFDNAGWVGGGYNQMVYGLYDPSVFNSFTGPLDVTAHEITHGVTSFTANLAYQNESGALNEATSDILGRSTAFWAGNGNPGMLLSWTIGVGLYKSGQPIRYMYDPAADGISADYYPTRNAQGCTPTPSNDYCGVHSNSGIGNLFYYLLAHGGSHPRGKTSVFVNGVGIAAAQSIWYTALTTRMTAGTGFAGARTATADAAAALYGVCSATWQSVEKAWDAVGVPGTWSCAAPSNRVALRRWYNPSTSDHFYSITNYSNLSGFSSEGITGYLEKTQVAGTAPFQRFYAGPPRTDHFYTTSSQEVQIVLNAGFVYEGVEGYIFTGYQTGLTPLYRLSWCSGYGDCDHLYTTDANEKTQAIQLYGWGYDGLAGWVWPTP